MKNHTVVSFNTTFERMHKKSKFEIFGVENFICRHGVYLFHTSLCLAFSWLWLIVKRTGVEPSEGGGRGPVCCGWEKKLYVSEKNVWVAMAIYSRHHHIFKCLESLGVSSIFYLCGWKELRDWPYVTLILWSCITFRWLNKTHQIILHLDTNYMTVPSSVWWTIRNWSSHMIEAKGLIRG